MIIRPMSDLHNEGCQMLIPMMPNEDQMVLTLAGDICQWETPSSFKDFFRHLRGRFKAVIYIPGNHEYYRGSIMCARRKFMDVVSEVGLENFHVLNQEYVCIEDTVFIGATLWTDFNDNDWFAKHAAKTNMNDYAVIRTGPTGFDEHAYSRKLTVEDTYVLHQSHRKFIFEAIKIHKDNGKKVVVMTHHAPSTMSMHPRYAGDTLNWAYMSRLEDEILATQPNLWLHGHMHDAFDYKIGDTRIVVNPRGYARVANIARFRACADALNQGIDYDGDYSTIFNPENKGFNPYLLVEV